MNTDTHTIDWEVYDLLTPDSPLWQWDDLDTCGRAYCPEWTNLPVTKTDRFDMAEFTFEAMRPWDHGVVGDLGSGPGVEHP
jgi:hypothetical protein